MATGTSMSSYLEDQLLNWFKGTTFVASPATLYCALYTANPTDAQASGTEVSGTATGRTPHRCGWWG